MPSPRRIGKRYGAISARGIAMEGGAVLFALSYMAAPKLELAKGEKIADPMVWLPFELGTPANMDTYLKKN